LEGHTLRGLYLKIKFYKWFSDGGELYTSLNVCGEYYHLKGDAADEEIILFVESLMDFRYVPETFYTQEQWDAIEKSVFYEDEFTFYTITVH